MTNEKLSLYRSILERHERRVDVTCAQEFIKAGLFELELVKIQLSPLCSAWSSLLFLLRKLLTRYS